MYYPWWKAGQFDAWDHKLVKLIGMFKAERFFVRRAKDGK